MKEILELFELTACAIEPCLFISKTGDFIVIIYVDDILYFSTTTTRLDAFDTHLKKHFTIKVTSTISKYVGHEILQQDNMLSIHAAGYIHACLIKFGLEESNGRYNPGIKGMQIKVENSPRVGNKK